MSEKKRVAEGYCFGQPVDVEQLFLLDFFGQLVFAAQFFLAEQLVLLAQHFSGAFAQQDFADFGQDWLFTEQLPFFEGHELFTMQGEQDEGPLVTVIRAPFVVDDWAIDDWWVPQA